MTARFRAALIGQDTLLTECAGVLLDAGHEVVQVLTDAPKVRDWAMGRSIACTASDAALEEVDFLFAVTHLSLLSETTLSAPKIAAINFHDGPLPEWTGLNTPVWGLLDGVTRWGIRWHLMTADVDAGDVVAARDFDVARHETALSLNTKNFVAGLEAFRELVPMLADGSWRGTAQPEGERKRFKRKDRPEHGGFLDFGRSAEALAQQVRALTFGPYANPVSAPKVLLSDQVLLVESAEAAPEDTGATPGSVLDATPRIACREGTIRLGGLRTLDGTPVEAIEAGVVLPALPSDDWSARLGRHEAYWVERIRAFEAPDLGIEQEPTGRRTRLALRLPRELHAAELEAAFIAFLGRRSGGQTVDVVVPARWDGPAALRICVAPWVPLRLDTPPTWTRADAEASVSKAKHQTTKRATYLLDLLVRDPVLRPPAATVGLAEGQAAGGPGVLLDAGDAALLVDEAWLRAGEDLRRRFELFLTRWLEGAALAEVSLLSDDEQTQLVRWGTHERPFDAPDTVVAQIEAQVDRTPDAPAVVAEGFELSYREVDERANHLAHRLVSAGVTRGSRVGVSVQRSVDLVVAPLAVMKTGAAYVPIDPDYPAERTALMAEDAKLDAAVVGAGLSIAFGGPTFAPTDAREDQRIDAGPSPEDRAYIIFTSGSTGRPKGVEVEHRNVVNFFTGMDDVIPRQEGPETWLAVTSLSFDISVLELWWTLARGMRVVVHTVESKRKARKKNDMAFGLFMWGNDDGPGPGKYRMLIDGAKYLDENGFESVWMPERHFHAFGGPYPNPSVLAAAVATHTKNMSIRAGSCVSPLHHPIRVAEEWSVVDNLSDGRVGLSFAAGWQPDDFILRPESFGRNKEVMFESIEQVRALWRGEAVSFPHPMGGEKEVRTLPRPVQAELPIWVTSAGNPETYRMAGEVGGNILTHLLGQSIEEVADKIRIYREARAAAGRDRGYVTLMLHTLVGDDPQEVRETVRGPLKSYLASSLGLLKKYAWTFPAFKSPTSPQEVDLDALTEGEVDAMMDHAFDRYFDTSGLFGTVDQCLDMADRLAAAGVDEIACLLDFGTPTQRVLDSLPKLAELRSAVRKEAPQSLSLSETIERYRVTHMQCTPSMARMALELEPHAFDQLPHLLVGGEALPIELAQELSRHLQGTLLNMYGPTETTVWSSVDRVWASDQARGAVSEVTIGRPIANTTLLVLDDAGRMVPPGSSGELFIGGWGVVRGYLDRPELTSERFGSGPNGGRVYRTGDKVRWGDDGRLRYIGRTDDQVKIRGHRIEVQEIEAQLVQLDGVGAAVVVPQPDAAGVLGLVAYLRAEPGFDPASARGALKGKLPEFMVPGRIVMLDAFPLTPNGKVDRKTLAKRPLEVERAPMEAESTEASPLELQIREVWTQALGRADIRVEDNFFDVGGHSLLIVQVHRDLKSRFEALSLTDLYRFPTIRTLAEHLGRSDEDAPDPSLAKATSRAMKRKALLRGRRGA